MNRLVFRSLALLLVLVFLSACQRDTPERAALEFMDSLAAMDFQRATELSTPSAELVIGILEMAAAGMSDSELREFQSAFGNYRHVSTSIDGDRAVVVLSMEGQEESIDMRRIDGQWLVDINKDDMQK